MKLQPIWEKMLSRWSSLGESGEKRLMVSLLASVLAEESRQKPNDRFRSAYFVSGRFDRHLSLIGLDPQFVREQVERLDTYAEAA